ncbi:MAG: UvrD-helicase domain-containing protein [Bacteroides sp.]|nr:UvrD-helicase domain-containing protein [Bacteroides sp.]
MIDMDFATDDEIKYAHDTLLNGYPDFDDEKLTIILSNKSTDIKACPGSGKTTTLLAKLVILANKMPLPANKGICVLTHTNVAIDEIKSKLRHQANVLFNYPNYFGTIQGFVDKYLTIPYFNSVSDVPIAAIDSERASIIFENAFSTKGFKDLTCIWGQIVDRIPKTLTGKDKNIRVRHEQREFLFGSFYSVDKNSFYKEYGANRAIASDVSKPMFQLLYSTRCRPLRSGVLKFEDAFSYGMAYINRCAILRDAFSERFSYLFIDEMQDTNELQYDLLEKIFDKEKVIVQRFGDPFQSIFEHGKMKWKPNSKSLPINFSNRFGENIASVLRTVCEKNNTSLKGNTAVESHKPILLVFDNPLDVLPKFANLVTDLKIGNKTILELANEEKNKDSLHRNRIKAVGWVGKEKKDGLLRLPSYYPSYEVKTSTRPHYKQSLFEYIRKSDIHSVQDCIDNIINAISNLLDRLGILYEDGRRSLRYTKTRVESFLKDNYPEHAAKFRTKISEWALDILKTTEDINIETFNSIRNYINNELSSLFMVDQTSEVYKSFMKEYEIQDNDKKDSINKHSRNVYKNENAEIEIATIHSVKGETHIATLYMETAYKDKYESQRIGDQLCGIPYQGRQEVTLMTLRMAYVAMSRPKYLLCFAIQKCNFQLLRRDKLSTLWDIIEI